MIAIVNKKDATKYTIKFNAANPRHREAMRLLNETARGKAALIADALCMYAHYGVEAYGDLIGSGWPLVEAQSPMIVKNERYLLSAASVLQMPPSAGPPEEDGIWNTINDSLESFLAT